MVFFLDQLAVSLAQVFGCLLVVALHNGLEVFQVATDDHKLLLRELFSRVVGVKVGELADGENLRGDVVETSWHSLFFSLGVGQSRLLTAHEVQVLNGHEDVCKL